MSKRLRSLKAVAAGEDGEGTVPMEEAARAAKDADTDQWCAMMASVGRASGAYYQALLKAGIPEGLANGLLATWSEIHWSANYNVPKCTGMCD